MPIKAITAITFEDSSNFEPARDSLQEVLNEVLTHLHAGAFLSEAAISGQAIVPVLQQLGWGVFNPAEVVRDYTTPNGRVDYALCLAGTARVFVDVKQARDFSEGAEQLLDTAFAEGIELAVLTDARRWSIYLSTGPVPFQERLVELLDIVDRPAAEAAEVLRRYLEHGAVQSGDNVKAAREDLHNIAPRARRRKAAAKIPDAWLSLLEESDGVIARCLAQRVEEYTGVCPAREDIRDYLARVQVPNIRQGEKSASTPVQDDAPLAVQRAHRSVASSMTALQVFDAAAQSDFHKVRNPATTIIYKRRWLAFAKWCDSNGHPWLPASPEHVVSWLETNWPRFVAQSLTHDLAAIRLVHNAHGQPDPVTRGGLARQCLARLTRKEWSDGRGGRY